jgi:hypothetical protein
MVTVGAMPLTARLAPDGVHVVLSLSGYGQQGLQVVDRTTDGVHPVVEQTSAFVGLAFSPDGARSIRPAGTRTSCIDTIGMSWAPTCATAWCSPSNVERMVRGIPPGSRSLPDGRTLVRRRKHRGLVGGDRRRERLSRPAFSDRAISVRRCHRRKRHSLRVGLGREHLFPCSHRRETGGCARQR